MAVSITPTIANGELVSQNQLISLTRFQFCHVRDENTVELSLVEGPTRRQLESHETLVGKIERKIRLFDGQWTLVLNPFNEEAKDIVEGEREIRVGPCIFSLHPGEELDEGIQDEIVLNDDQGLLLRANKDAPHPLKDDKTICAGTEVLIKGPRRFVPHKDIEIVSRRKSLPLSENQGVYIQNNDTGVVRLERGPADIFLEHNESFWNKKLTREEEQALGLAKQSQVDDTSRVLATEPSKRKNLYEAIVIQLEDNEVIELFDGDKRRIEFGPKKVFLDPHECPKVLFISGGVPVKPNVLRLAKLCLGPDFIRDQLRVRTKDNATLTLDVTYRWRFQVDTAAPEKLFALKDFVGFVAQTLSSEIREAAAGNDFETFHSEAASIVKKAVFADEETRLFEVNGLEIFGIDVEGITPEDEEIARKLTDAIKSNVDIFTRRQNQQAELESERCLIEGKKKNEAARNELISEQLSNKRKKVIEKAKIKAEAARLTARANAAATKLTAEAKAEATRVKGKATNETAKKALENQAEVLGGEGGSKIIELERARTLKATDKLVIPTDSKLVLGLDRELER
jgi:major vault protein